MADHEDWTARDDDQLRGALALLKQDVDALLLPDVRFVRARGVRRRRQRALALTAAAAAAAVVVGAVGFSQLGRDTGLPVVPATRTTGTTGTAPPSTTATTPPDSLGQPGALPLLQEWTRTLDLQGAARMTTQDPKSSDWSSFECLTSVPNGQVQRQEVVLDAGGFQGGQTRFTVSSSLDPTTVADGLASDIAGCQQGPGFTVAPTKAAGWPRVFSYTAGDAGSGWFAVVPGKADVTLIQVVDAAHPTSVFTRAQVGALAAIAQKRLARYGTGTSGSSSTSTSPADIGPTGSTRALSQDMPVAGAQPVPTSPLFVAASQWRSQALSGGVATTAGPGALEGATAVASCETDAQQAGIGGRVGIVSVMAGTGTTSYVGRQRVQLDESSTAEVQQSYVDARLAEANALYAKGCTFPNGKVTSTKGPSKGTYRLDTVFTDGSPALSEWVGVTAQQTQGAVSTVVITKMAEPKQGFAELDRLLMLARQK